MNRAGPTRSRLVLIAAGLYGAVALLCTRIPLVNYLGYEFSFLVALLASGLSGLISISATRHGMHEHAGASVSAVRSATASLRSAVRTSLLLLFIPFSVMGANALFVKNCSILEGCAFFVLLPVVSSLFSCGLGFFCAVHYRWSRTVFAGAFVATVVYALALGYFTPAIFSYNVFYGYFPGLTYDEILEIRWPLIFFRGLTLLLGVVLVWLGLVIVGNIPSNLPAWRKGKDLLLLLAGRRYRMGSVAGALLLALLYLFRCDLGWESTSGSIRRSLGGEFRSDHCTIYYSPGSYTDEEIRWVAAEHEFQLSRIMDAFYLQRVEMIESYIYPSNEVKQELVGAGSTNIAKPWSRQIHISKQSLAGTLRHEMTHVVAGDFGLPAIRASLSTGLVEGLAMAIDWDWGNRTLHQYAAALRKFDLAPDISRLLTISGFATQSASISYVLAGSFCRYLIDRYGIRKMTQVYRNGDYGAVYGRPLDALIEEWHHSLDRIPIDAGERDAVDVFFRTPPIFEKVCARVVARRNMAARKAMEQRDFAKAQELYRMSYVEAGGYESLSGYLLSSLRLADYAALSAARDTIVDRAAHPAQFLPLMLSIGDAAWAQGNVDSALSCYRRIVAADFSESYSEAARLRQLAIADTGHRGLFLKFFLEDRADSMSLRILDSIISGPAGSPTALYLRGGVLRRKDQPAEEISLLAAISMRDEDLSLEGLRLRHLGAALVRLGRFEEAKSAFWTSLNYTSREAAINRINESIDRCDWIRAHALPFP
jgi:hypothetical protein